MDSDIIIKAIPQNAPVMQTRSIRKPLPFRIFSLLFLIFLFVSLYHWCLSFTSFLAGRSPQFLTRQQLLDSLEFDNSSSFEQTALRMRFYRVASCAYSEPNILLMLGILLTWGEVLNFIEKESATSVAFFEFNGNSIYLQILRLGLDGVQYVLTSKCFCLVSGAGAIWIHLLTKVTYYNLNNLTKQPLKLVCIVLTYLIFFSAVVLKDRVDVLIGLAVALLDIAFLTGGTIKYPKQVYQEKERFAEWIKLDRCWLWEKFSWNEYTENEQLCVDSHQYYVSREDRYANNRQ